MGEVQPSRPDEPRPHRPRGPRSRVPAREAAHDARRVPPHAQRAPRGLQPVDEPRPGRAATTRACSATRSRGSVTGAGRGCQLPRQPLVEVPPPARRGARHPARRAGGPRASCCSGGRRPRASCASAPTGCTTSRARRISTRAIEGLADRDLVVRLERRPGQKESRYAHLLGGEVADTAAVVVAPGPVVEHRAGARADRAPGAGPGARSRPRRAPRAPGGGGRGTARAGRGDAGGARDGIECLPASIYLSRTHAQLTPHTDTDTAARLRLATARLWRRLRTSSPRTGLTQTEAVGALHRRPVRPDRDVGARPRGGPQPDDALARRRPAGRRGACSSARRTRTTAARSSSRRPTPATRLRTETVQARNDVLAHELDRLSRRGGRGARGGAARPREARGPPEGEAT